MQDTRMATAAERFSYGMGSGRFNDAAEALRNPAPTKRAIAASARYAAWLDVSRETGQSFGDFLKFGAPEADTECGECIGTGEGPYESACRSCRGTGQCTAGSGL